MIRTLPGLVIGCGSGALTAAVVSTVVSVVVFSSGELQDVRSAVLTRILATKSLIFFIFLKV
jgi:hypothetical protein